MELGVGSKKVYKTVKAGHIVINGAEQFATHANSIITGIQTCFTSKSEIQILELDDVESSRYKEDLLCTSPWAHTLVLQQQQIPKSHSADQTEIPDHDEHPVPRGTRNYTIARELADIITRRHLN